jgi:hypothetical protein
LFFRVGFPSENTENYTLEYLFQHMPGSLPVQQHQMYLSQQSQYHIQTNAFPFQPELNNDWTKVSYKRGRGRGRSTLEETGRETKHSKEGEHWLNQTSTSSRYTAVLEEEREDQQQKTGPDNTPKNLLQLV